MGETVLINLRNSYCLYLQEIITTRLCFAFLNTMEESFKGSKYEVPQKHEYLPYEKNLKRLRDDILMENINDTFVRNSSLQNLYLNMNNPMIRQGILFQ